MTEDTGIFIVGSVHSGRFTEFLLEEILCPAWDPVYSFFKGRWHGLDPRLLSFYSFRPHLS